MSAIYPRTEAVLAEARNPDGSQRFYPPGEHPATARLRAHLAALVEAMDAAGESDDVSNIQEAAAYAREQVARFEAGEDRAKLEYLRRVLTDERERIAGGRG